MDNHNDNNSTQLLTELLPSNSIVTDEENVIKWFDDSLAEYEELEKFTQFTESLKKRAPKLKALNQSNENSKPIPPPRKKKLKKPPPLKPKPILTDKQKQELRKSNEKLKPIISSAEPCGFSENESDKDNISITNTTETTTTTTTCTSTSTTTSTHKSLDLTDSNEFESIKYCNRRNSLVDSEPFQKLLRSSSTLRKLKCSSSVSCMNNGIRNRKPIPSFEEFKKLKSSNNLDINNDRKPPIYPSPKLNNKRIDNTNNKQNFSKLLKNDNDNDKSRNSNNSITYDNVTGAFTLTPNSKPEINIYNSPKRSITSVAQSSTKSSDPSPAPPPLPPRTYRHEHIYDEIVNFLPESDNESEDSAFFDKQTISRSTSDLSEKKTQTTNNNKHYLEECNGKLSIIINEESSSAEYASRYGLRMKKSTSTNNILSTTLKSIRNSLRKRRNSSGFYCPRKTALEKTEKISKEETFQQITQRSNSLPDVCNAKERASAILEIFNTEKNFGMVLDLMKNELREPLRKSCLLDCRQIDLIFNNLDQLIDMHRQLLKAIETQVQNGNLNDICIGEIFSKNSSLFLAYDTYCNGTGQAQAYLEQLQNQKEILAVFLKSLQTEKDHFNRMHLKDFLIQPVQRIMKYPLLLKRIDQQTPPQHPDKIHLKEACRKIQRILKHINSTGKYNTLSLRPKKSEALRQMLADIEDIGESRRYETVLEELQGCADDCILLKSGKVWMHYINEPDWLEKVSISKLTKIHAYLIEKDHLTYLIFATDTISNTTGRHTILKTIDLQFLIVTDFKDFIEIQDLIENETFAVKAFDDVDDTGKWCDILKIKTQNAGHWRGRRMAITSFTM